MTSTLTPVHVVDHVVLTGGRNLHPGQPDVHVDLTDPHNAALATAGRIIPAGPSAVAGFDPSAASDEQLGEWVASSTVADILAAVTDKTTAQRVLDIEQSRPQPRSTIVEPLTRLANQEDGQ